MKNCKLCKENKPDDCFRFKDNRLYYICKDCEKIENKRYSSSEEGKTRRKKYIDKNREKINEYSRLKMSEYCKENKERMMISNKKSYIKNYPKNKLKIAERRKEKRKLGLNDKEKQWYRNRMREKEKESLSFKMKRRLQSRLHFALNGIGKSCHTLELLGCSIEFLKQYLELKFQENMSWENYGKFGWHIDHIRPCSSFDLSNLEEQKLCFHYTNLQPLWAKDNLAKGYKYGIK